MSGVPGLLDLTHLRLNNSNVKDPTPSPKTPNPKSLALAGAPPLYLPRNVMRFRVCKAWGLQYTRLRVYDLSGSGFIGFRRSTQT